MSTSDGTDYRTFFDNAEAKQDFRTIYSIPADVQVELIPSSSTPAHLPNQLIFPLHAIIEGGIRFPLDPFFRRVICALNLTPAQMTINFFRIIMGIVELIRIHRLDFRPEDFFAWYTISHNKPSRRYFPSIRKNRERLILSLPDSDRLANDFVTVTGRYEIINDSCTAEVPWRIGTLAPKICDRLKLGSSQYRINTLLNIPASDREAPKLLGYIPKYHSFLKSKSKKKVQVISDSSIPEGIPLGNLRHPVDRTHPEYYSESESDNMGSKRPVKTPLNLAITAGISSSSALPDSAQEATLARKRRKTAIGSEAGVTIAGDRGLLRPTQTERTEGGTPRSAPSHPGTTNAAQPWTWDMTVEGRPLLETDSVRNVNVAKSFARGLVLPADMAEVNVSEKQLYETALCASLRNTQHIIQLRANVRARDIIVTAVEADNKRLKEDLEANKSELQSVLETATKVDEEQRRRIAELKDKLANDVADADAKGYEDGYNEAGEEYKRQVDIIRPWAFKTGYLMALDAAGVPSDSLLRSSVPSMPNVPPPSITETISPTGITAVGSSSRGAFEDPPPPAN